jgi:anti-anti-sigma factor
VSVFVGERSTLRTSEIGWSSHVCWAYASDAEHRDFLVEFFQAGLAANERLLYFAPPEQLHATLSELADAGMDIDSLLERQVLRVDNLDEAYLIDGELRPDVRLAGHALLVGQALRDGYSGLRVCSEIVSLLGSDGASDEWCGYEVRADLLISKLPSIVVCACDLRRAPPTVMSDLHAVHSLHIGAPTCHSPFRMHAGPEGLLLSGEVDASSAGRVGRWLAEALPDMPEPVVDVEGLEFIDAAGMWALLDSAHAHPEGLRLVGTSERFRRVWAVCGYDTIPAVQLN